MPTMQDPHSLPELTDEDLEYLLVRTRSGDPLQERTARRELEDWIHDDPQRQSRVAALTHSHAAIASAAAELRSRYPRTVQLPPSPRQRRRGLRFAGALTAFAALTASIWFANPALSKQRYETGIGERSTVTLRDGSNLHINTHSRVEFVNRLRTREIVLSEGEVFFDVEHSAFRPFVVAANGSTVRVHGTRFNVRDLPDGTVRIVVEHGEVEVSPQPGGEPIVLTDGQAVDAQHGLLTSSPHTVDVGMLTAWRQGLLVFASTPLKDVVAQIQRYRVAPVEIADARAGALTLTGAYPLQDPDALLRVLPHVLPINVHFKADGAVSIAAR